MSVFKFLIFCYVSSVLGSQELLGNNDFENSQSISPWSCNQCTATMSSISYHGQHSVSIHGRTHKYSGLGQTFSVHGGKHYQCNVFIKLMTSNFPQGKMYANLHMTLKYTTSDGKHHYKNFANDKYHQPEFDWDEFGGDFWVPSGVNSVNMYIQIDDPNVNYLVDKASCKEIPHDPQWKTKANDRINKIRKGTLRIDASSSNSLDTNGVTVEIKQLRSKFALGTAFKSQYITDSSHKAYQDFLYNNFEWGVPENALKWRLMEWTRGHPNYDKGIDAVKAVRAHGLKVRGHNMFWAGSTHNPKWLSGLSNTEMLQDMHNRVNEMTARSRGMLEHWDVNNEDLHGDFFQEHLGAANITYDMFKWIHDSDPSIKLFLNEFQIVSSSLSTTAYKNQGRRFKTSGVPLYGLGVQSHLPSSNVQMDVLKYRLDKVAEAGLPIWITELSIMDSNDVSKASALDDVMTLYLSYPSIEGVLLWGFWDGAVYNTKIALASGSAVTPNAAGKKWQELFHQRFRTNTAVSLNGQNSITIRVFLGDYHLTFKRNGQIIHSRNITVDNTVQNITVIL